MKIRVRVLSVFLALLPTFAAAGIDRIEPPFWWQGFEHRELQLLVHGDDIANLSAAVAYPGVSVERVETGNSPNYLFVYLDIAPDTKPGIVDIVFSEGEYTIERAFELRQRNAEPGYVRGLNAGDAKLHAVVLFQRPMDHSDVLMAQGR